MQVKILLYKSKIYKDGTSPVVATININRTPKRKVLFSINPKYWDFKNGIVKKSHPLYPEYNSLITEKQYIFDKKIIEAKIKNIPITEDYIFGTSNQISIIEAFNIYIENLRSQKKRLSNFLSIVKDLQVFGDIAISLIDNEWAKRFYNYLMKKNSKNTSAKKIQRINTVLITHGYGVKIDTPKEMNTKNKLSEYELSQFKQIRLNGMIELVRDTFMLAFYLRGRRIGDILTLEHQHYKNGRITKYAEKTNKKMDIKVVPEAAAIIEKYKGLSEYYILPFMKLHPDTEIYKFKKSIESKTAVINRYLKIIAEMCDIDKNITTHVSRHTFAYLADQHGMTGKRIQDMLEHSDLKTTQNYIHDLNNTDMLDSAMDNFIGKLGL